MNISMENELAEKIANLLDEYLETEIEDLTHIQQMIDAEKKIARVRQRKQNMLDEINGGSK
jgi:GTP-binding protein EngB required for normal cell division